jgi:hypothetical protein
MLGMALTMSDETRDVICDSLKTHPTLQVLHSGPHGSGTQVLDTGTRGHAKSEHVITHHTFA